MRLVWLASYPRSGNTWMRALLCHYLHGAPASSADINARIPDLDHMARRGQRLNADAADHLICKTHVRCDAEHRFIEHTAGFILLLRHPRDVLLSLINFFRLTNHMTLDDASFARAFIRDMGVPWWQANMGSWLEFNTSWLAAAGRHAHLVLRYEDMLRDPQAGLARALRFINVEPEPVRLAEAVAGCSLENMRRWEEQEKAAGELETVFWGLAEAAKQGRFFVNSGVSGGRLEALGADLDAEFDARFGEVLQLMGYA
jgi:hypothetical protein